MNSTVIDSPVGPLRLQSNGDQLVAILFAPTPDARTTDKSNAVLVEAADQLRGYFAGKLRSFELPLRPMGTSFQLRTWRALQDLAYGETVSYAEIARRIGHPRAVRAVGSANGRNPLPVVVPCHRVIGSDGSLTGYAGGLAIKHRLLELEAANS